MMDLNVNILTLEEVEIDINVVLLPKLMTCKGQTNTR